ncbi:MAG: hypothetical protein ABEL51_13905 [Salinibacter sp.]
MSQLMLTINDREKEFLENAAADLEQDVSRQDLLRALMLLSNEDKGLLEEAQKLARRGEKLQPKLEYQPGEAKGLTEADYREAVREEGSILGASETLGVARTTVREQCKRYEIEVPTLGGVPE